MENGKRGISRKQAAAIEFFLNDKHQSKARALRMAGYGESIARQPHKVFGSSIVRLELEKRGYDQVGIRQEPQAIVNEPLVTVTPTPGIDFSLCTPEFLQALKAKLAEIPEQFVNENKTNFHTPLSYAFQNKQNSSAPWPSCM